MAVEDEGRLAPKLEQDYSAVVDVLLVECKQLVQVCFVCLFSSIRRCCLTIFLFEYYRMDNWRMLWNVFSTLRNRPER